MKKPLETRPIERLTRDPHDYDQDPRTDRCAVCRLPESNRLHDPANQRRQPTAEQRAADLARLGEREDED